MLRAKLTAFPGAVYDKEPVGVCAAPQLSDLTEATEPDLGGAPRTAARPGAIDTSGSSRDTRHKIAPSPVAEDDETDVSLLLVAATGDAGDADIVDLLAREALGPERPAAAPPAVLPAVPPAARGPTIVSDTTTGDSTVDYVENTPLDVLERGDRPSFDNRDVENFFSRHLAENGDRDVAVSPALARRINRSSLESSAGDVASTPSSAHGSRGVDRDVLDCLSKMLDEVCEHLDRCVGYLRADERRDARPTIEDVADPSGAGPSERRVEERASKKIKLKFAARSPRVARKGGKGGPRRRRDVSEPAPRSTRVENDNRDPEVNPHEVIREKRSKNSCDEAPPCRTPQTRRKRKLYSPKDVVDDSASIAPRESEADGCKKFLDAPYKEIENIRNKSLIESRKKIRTPLSSVPPRAQRLNDIFDSLKNTIEGERNITLVARNTRNRGAVYNFPSDSDDEDFRAKENAVATGRRKKRPARKPPAGRTRRRPAGRGAKRDRPPVELERARTAPSSPLEISFEAERPREPAGGDPEPAGTSQPAMEFVATDRDDGDAIEKRSARPRRKRRDPERPSESRGSNISTSARPVDGDVTGSPLPGLVVEEIRAADDVNAASICNLEGLDITADRLALDRSLSSPADTRPRSRLERNSPDAAPSGSRAGKKRQLSTRKRKPADAPVKRCPRLPAPETRASTDDADRRAADSDTGSERSIATLGKSPITAHGDVDEAPPSARLLARPLTERRAIEAVDLSETLRAYYDELAGEIERRGGTSGGSSGGGSVSNQSPVVLVARLSPEVIGGWTPARLASARSSSGVVASRPTSRGVASDARRERISTISPILPFGDGDVGRGRTSARSREGSGAAKEPARQPRSRRSGSTPSSGGYDPRSSRRGRRGRAGAASPAGKVALAHDDVRSESQIGSEDSPSPAESRSTKRRRLSAMPSRADAASAVSEWVWRSGRDASPEYVAGDAASRARAAADAVLEKLDTTLQEIHHNTSTKLVSMFVEVGRGAAALRAERERLYRAAVRDVLVDVVAVIDAKFTDLERRCGEATAAWERGVRAAARGVLRDDCRQKRDLLALVRDDLRADQRAAPRSTR
ncbi:uncharacterized protein LOC121730497 [Aricia agestis]|uniref:uncharacterized protein LOC121730497 n=1 Tax=Aricia agestis TaxID=91739 RepID=UPI001C20A218|nr:uncharacterized protein LOC121730497 [Aricia agestis]